MTASSGEGISLPDLFDVNGMPIFDKTRLLTDEFKPYRYTLEFKETSVVDMKVGGYMEAIRPYQAGGYTVEHIGTYVTGATIYCQVKVKLQLHSGVVFESLGDADNRGTPDGDTCLRTAESVAFKRAVCRALNISPCDFGNVESDTKYRGGDRGGSEHKTRGPQIDWTKIKRAPRDETGTSLRKDGNAVWEKCL